MKSGYVCTIAEGIARKLPLRCAAVLKALRESGGGAIAVSEGDIRDALVMLVRTGFYVEPTSAVAAAGLLRLREGAQISRGSSSVIVVLTGIGLKAGRRVADIIEEESTAHTRPGGSTDA